MLPSGGPPHAPQKLDLCLEGLASFQEGAAGLKAGDPLCLQPLEGGRLACATRSGTAVGLIPADKRGTLSRGPWSGTVRSVRRQAATAVAVGPAATAGPGPTTAALGAPADAAAAAQAEEQQQQQGSTAAHSTVEEQQQDSHEQVVQQQDEAAAVLPTPAAGDAEAPPAAQQPQQQQQQQVVMQVLVRFTPEEQRWEQRGAVEGQSVQEEDVALLSTEQLHMLAASEELRWMLRDERLQKMVGQIDEAADRERALLRALQAPNFKEFADKVLAVVAPEPPQ